MSDQDRESTLRFLASPTAVNFGGNIHGGSAMKWLDEAGYTCATAWSESYCVTAFVGDINFHSRISVGDLVEINAKIIHTGRTSMHVFLELSSGAPRTGELTKSMHCIMVFVAVDEDGRPNEIPTWKPETESDIGLEKYALSIMELRKANQKKLSSLVG